MEKEIVNWIKNQQDNIEEAIINSAKEFKVSKLQSIDEQTFLFDVRETSCELWNLVNGKDLCYDRPSIGFTYSLWYHCKRVINFLHFFLKLFLSHSNEERIILYDLGAGTGAVQWAVGLVYAGLKSYSKKTPRITVVNVDSSPFMLEYNEKFLWKNFLNNYPECTEIEVKYSINSWPNTNVNAEPNVWLTASYLFDHSENGKELSKEFLKLIEDNKPSKILLSSAIPKQLLVDTVAEALINSRYKYQNLSSQFHIPIFNGFAIQINNYRRKIQPKNNYGFSGEVRWDRDSLYGRVLLLPQYELPIPNGDISPYTAAQPIRTKVKLSDEQIEASKHTGKPTLIDGPAGSGKTIVLSERIRNIVESLKYDPTKRILVTTYNKGVIKLLGDWIEKLLVEGQFERRFEYWHGEQLEHSFFFFNGATQPNITLYNFDKLPTRLGNLRFTPIVFENEIQLMKQAMAIVVHEQKIDEKKYKTILSPKFLLEEYHRIIYGQICNTASKYYGIERRGMGRTPKLNAGKIPRRIYIWKIINKYLTLMGDNRNSFISGRHRFLRSVINNGFPTKYDIIFVDENQDCTKADFEIFEQLVKNKDVVVAGDFAQSINLGSSSYIPKDYERKKLSYSYRLPLRVSQAIRPLSAIIKNKHKKRNAIGDPDIIMPFKGSPPGSRPIIVYAESPEEMARKIKTIFSCYKLYEFEEISIFEKDEELSSIFSQNGISNRSERILKTKGLERACVLWSTKANINSSIDIEESVYTIFTRTSAVLIIAVFNDIIEPFKQIISLLDKERLIVWDYKTDIHFKNLCNNNSETAEEIDNDDDSELQPEEIDDTE